MDTFGFDPDSDGTVIYSRTVVFDLDLDSARSGGIWRQRATTIDQLRFPQDPRISFGMTAYVRHLRGRPLLYCIGQYGGGFGLYGLEQKQNYLARPMAHITAPGETWAWDIAPNGDIWHGDYWRGEREGGSIRRFVFKGWTTDGSPLFETNKPDVWPWPGDFRNVRRVIYDADKDSLYLSGYLKGEDIDSWGVTGKTLRRYDVWLKGERKAAEP